MKHYILAKFKPDVAEKNTVFKEIRELFSEATQISGVTGINIYENCIQRANRYDVMIVLEMDREALSHWDESEIHRNWKANFHALLEKKAIFDAE